MRKLPMLAVRFEVLPVYNPIACEDQVERHVKNNGPYVLATEYTQLRKYAEELCSENKRLTYCLASKTNIGNQLKDSLAEALARKTVLEDKCNYYVAGIVEACQLLKNLLPLDMPFDLKSNLEAFLERTPQQCLRDVQAEAGRKGFIAGCLYDNEVHFNDAPFDINIGADMYADQVRQGGA